MTDISIQSLIKSFEQGKNILDGLSFDVLEGERVGLLGKNGAGKTTLFRLLVGEMEPDSGELVVAPGKRIGLISQIPVYPPEYTAEDVLRAAHARLDRTRARMEELEAKMAQGDQTVLDEYDKLLTRFEAWGGYDADTEVNKVANGLQISAQMRAQLFSSLSGGEKTRVNLARLLLEKTEILLLDEPTNHLDLKATEWLEDYLSRFKGTVLAISHDRWFLDHVVSRIVELRDGKAHFYSGNYSFYVEEKERRYQEQLRQYQKEQAKIHQLQAAADQMKVWAFMGNDKQYKRAFSMEKRIERMRKTDRPDKERKLTAKFTEAAFSGDEVLVVEGLSKSYGDRNLFRDVDLFVEPGECIALIGDNGTGKSTFLKLLLGEESPDKGWIRKGPAVRTAYLPQIIRFRDPSLSMLDMMIWDEKLSPQEARNRLGAFRFSGEDVFKTISTLSGGEQSRLRLCALMRTGINLLILDEPTNHLDILSREWIEEALEDYSEALLFVSHDRYFIDRFATRIWELRDGRIYDFRGTFAQFREKREREAQLANIQKKAAAKQPAAQADPPKQKSKPQNTAKQLAKLEKQIAALEDKIKALDGDADRFAYDYTRLLEIGNERDAAQEELYMLYEQWGELADGT